MCGIFGFVGNFNKEILQKMGNIMRHRGPDDSGFYFKDGVGLGNRRLSIIDLATGKQPILNEDGSIALIVNGEIYNYPKLKDELLKKGHVFKTKTDSEVIVHLYEELKDEFVHKLNGDFAIAIWDDNERKLLLYRDRLGIRPLYYSIIGNNIIFASEIRPILITDLVKKELNKNSLDDFLTLRYIPGSNTFFEGIKRLPQASCLKFIGGNVSIKSYWNISYEPKLGSSENIIEEFKELFEDSVKIRLMSDVPLGALLSGGVDSTSIVSMMARHSNKVKTFSIGFNTDIDETSLARVTSKLLGTDHKEILIKPNDYEFLPKIISFMDDPVGDAIIIPTYLLTKATAESVKVVLTGEGADEILGGYIHQFALNYADKYNRFFPRWFKNLNKLLIKGLPEVFLNKIFNYPAKLGSKGKNKLLKFISNLDDYSESYLALCNLFLEDKIGLYSKDFYGDISNNFGKLKNLFKETIYKSSIPNFFDRIIDTDINNWLVNYTLLKQDRLTMANSLEGRTPFLDHRLVEFTSRLPEKMKVSLLKDKVILRDAALKFISRKSALRKKKAFYIPTEKCFDSKFKNFVKEILNEKEIKRRGLFNYDYVKNLLSSLDKPELLDNKRLMAILILEIWMREFVDKTDLSNF